MTRKDKQLIRAHYPWMRLRFRADGTVEAQKARGGPWGTLYTARDAARHLEAAKAGGNRAAVIARPMIGR